jgi:hypothetical protein
MDSQMVSVLILSPRVELGVVADFDLSVSVGVLGPVDVARASLTVGYSRTRCSHVQRVERGPEDGVMGWYLVGHTKFSSRRNIRV